jgi:hypothetical protein
MQIKKEEKAEIETERYSMVRKRERERERERERKCRVVIDGYRMLYLHGF